MSHFLLDRISRSFYKLIYKIFFPKALHHNRRYWPFYKAERDQQQRLHKIYYKKQLVSSNEIREQKAQNKKCMLITTGPSIQTLDPKLLQQPDIDYIGVNGAISLDTIQFSSYVIIDHNFIMQRFDLVQKVLQTNCTFFTTPRCLDEILKRFQFKNIHCKIQTIETITSGTVETFLGPVKQFNSQDQDFFIYNKFGFSKDIYKGTFDYFTVAYVALQIIYAFNYKEIYIAGLDMNNFSQPRFYENKNNKQPTMLDHHTTEIFQAFTAAAQLFQDHQIKVWNLSLNSTVNSFEKIDAKYILNIKK